MPTVKGYACTRCGFTLTKPEGGQMYVMDNFGTRSICPHPGEDAHVARVLGVDEEALRYAFAQKTCGKGNPAAQHPMELFAYALSRTGFLSDCLCLNCLAPFKLDVHRDAKQCPACSSRHIKTAKELLKHRCPKCKQGTLQKRETGQSRELPEVPTMAPLEWLPTE